MVKKSKSIYIIGSVIIGVSAFLIVFLAILVSGVAGALPKLVFSSGSLEKTYDGTPLIYEDWKLESGELKEGYTVVFKSDGGRTDAGTSPNFFTVKISDEKGGDVTGKYNIEYHPGELNVKARPLSVKTDDASKDYDGEPLTCGTYDVADGSLVTGHQLSASVFGQRTDAGTSDNLFQAVVTNAAGGEVTHNYNIEKIYGKLEVKKRNISITTPNYIKVYDGEPLVCDSWEYASQTKILDGHEINVVVSGSQTDYGIGENTVGEVRITDGSKNVTSNYNITYLLGELIVEKRAITLRSEDAVKDYDGLPLVNPNWAVVSQTTILDGHSLFVIVNGEITEPGKAPNSFAEIRVDDAYKRNVTFNYYITAQTGDLIIRDPFAATNPPAGPDSLGNIDGENGGIGLPPEGVPDSDEAVVRVYSDVSGRIYLRYTSFGAYTGSGWLQAEEYGKLIDSKYSLNYLTGIALKSAGYISQRVRIESYSGNYLLPYYLDTFEKKYEIQTSDVEYTGDTSEEYSAYYYLFSYTEQGLKNYDLGEYKQLEEEYYKFVKEQYLGGMPQSTSDYFNGIIDGQGFSASNPNIIAQVAAYIQNAASYSLDYDRALDQSSDIAVSFLSTFKQGICQHYALAATMFYRALGIPARYTVGYTGITKAGEWVELGVMQAHAWVEVYLKGIGWVQIEVSGATPGLGGDNTGDDDGNNGPTLTVKPADLSMQYYVGAVLEAQGSEHPILGLNGLMAVGYTYKAMVTGSQTVAGMGYSIITEFVLYNAVGADVTNQFNIVLNRGKLHLYYWELLLTTESLSKTYDGTPLIADDDEYTVTGTFSKNHYIESVKFVSLLNVGQSENSCEIKIVDEYGEDVTLKYKINKSFGTLTVTAREIIITAGSADKFYDETPLTCSSYEITCEGGELPLADGDSAFVEIAGSQTVAGSCSNEIILVKILDKNGKDVTANYSIIYISGLLEVYRDK